MGEVGQFSMESNIRLRTGYDPILAIAGAGLPLKHRKVLDHNDPVRVRRRHV